MGLLHTLFLYTTGAPILPSQPSLPKERRAQQGAPLWLIPPGVPGPVLAHPLVQPVSPLGAHVTADLRLEHSPQVGRG